MKDSDIDINFLETSLIESPLSNQPVLDTVAALLLCSLFPSSTVSQTPVVLGVLAIRGPGPWGKPFPQVTP